VLVLVSLVEQFLVELSTNQTITHVVEGEGDKLMVKKEVIPDSSFQTLEGEGVIVEEEKEDKLLMKKMLEQDFLV